MEDVIKAFKRQDSEERIPVLRLEIDYELALLHEAMMENCSDKIEKCKNRLKDLRQEMLLLEDI